MGNEALFVALLEAILVLLKARVINLEVAMAFTTKVLEIVAPNHSPVLDESMPATLAVGETLDVKQFASDEDGDVLTYTLDPATDLATIEDGVITAVAVGFVTVKVDDGYSEPAVSPVVVSAVV